MIDMESIRKFMDLGEMKHLMLKDHGEFIKWVMRIGECRNILHLALVQFKDIKQTMNELEHLIPQFHKQPAKFKELEASINSIMSILQTVTTSLHFEEPEEELDDEELDESVEELDDEEEDYD